MVARGWGKLDSSLTLRMTKGRMIRLSRLIPICVLTDYIALYSHTSLAIQTWHLERELV